MKKYVLMLIVAFVACGFGTKAFAYDCEVDGIYYYRTSATELEVACKVFSDNNRTAYSGSVTIPSTVTYMGKTFNVTSIGEYAFYNCTAINALTLPTGITELGMGAFEGCSALTQMTIPAGISVVEDELFYGCSAMKVVVLPPSITAIGENAFTRCTSLLSVYLQATTAPSCEMNAFDKVDRTWCTLYIPKGSASYQQEGVWKDFFIEEFEGKVEDVKMNIQLP